jgi:hypothetical protein
MTTLTKTETEILRTAAEGAADGIVTPPKAAKTVAGLTAKGLITSTGIPEGGAAVYITEAGYAAVGHEPAGGDPPPTAEAALSPQGKIATLVALLRRDEGATVEAMMAATGWQAHSVRGALSGSVKKALGLTVVSEKVDGVRVYRIIDAAAA